MKEGVRNSKAYWGAALLPAILGGLMVLSLMAVISSRLEERSCPLGKDARAATRDRSQSAPSTGWKARQMIDSRPRKSRRAPFAFGLIVVALLLAVPFAVSPHAWSVYRLSRVKSDATPVQTRNELHITVFGHEETALFDIGAVRLAHRGRTQDGYFVGHIPGPDQEPLSMRNHSVAGEMYFAHSGNTQDAECSFYDVPFQVHGGTLVIAGGSYPIDVPRLILFDVDGAFLQQRRSLRSITDGSKEPSGSERSP